MGGGLEVGHTPDPASFEGTWAKRLSLHAWIPVAVEGLPLGLLLGALAGGVLLATLVWRLAAPAPTAHGGGGSAVPRKSKSD